MTAEARSDNYIPPYRAADLSISALAGKVYLTELLAGMRPQGANCLDFAIFAAQCYEGALISTG